jgi:hypothetical protein
MSSNWAHMLEQMPVVAIVIGMMVYFLRHVKEMNHDWKTTLIQRDAEMRGAMESLTKAVDSLALNTTRNTATLIMLIGKDGHTTDADVAAMERVVRMLKEIQ